VIVKKEGEGFIVNSKGIEICLDVIKDRCTYTVAVNQEGDYDYCPLGKKCKKPTEGWVDLHPFSVLITPKGSVITDGKTSVGIYRVPEAIHVDFVIGFERREDVPFQDIRLMEEGDYVEPFRGIVFREDMIHKMKLEGKWFELISKEEKVVEGRVLDEKRKKLRTGHVIEFKMVDAEKYLYAIVKSIAIYENFKELLEREGTARVLPGLSLEEGLKVYEKFYGPNAGPALAIRLELL